MNYSMPGSSVHGILQARILIIFLIQWLHIQLPWRAVKMMSPPDIQTYLVWKWPSIRSFRWFPEDVNVQPKLRTSEGDLWAPSSGYSIKDMLDLAQNIQFSSVTQSCLTLCDPMNCSTPGFFVHQLLELAQTHVHWVGDGIQSSHPLPSPSPPAFNLSRHQCLFQWVSFLHQVDKVLELHFSISPSKEYSGLISFRMEWFDHLAVRGTLKSLLQHHSSKASLLWYSVFFMIQLSYPLDYWKNNSFDYMDICR